MIIAPILLAVIFLAGKCCCCAAVRRIVNNQLRKTVFNRIIIFLEGIMIMATTCSWINIHRVYKDVLEPYFSFYFSCGVLSFFCIFSSVLVGYLVCKFSALDDPQVRARIGSAYENFDANKMNRIGKKVFLLTFFQMVRRVLLGYSITFGQDNIFIQFMAVNFSSLLLIGLLGTFKPYENSNAMEIGNEFMVLIVFSLLTCQTDLLTVMKGRSIIGWCLIGVISLSVFVNFSYIML